MLPGEVSAKKPSLTLNLGTNGLKVTSEPPPMAGQAGRLQGQDRSAVYHTSSSHARRCLIWLSYDNRCTRYTAPPNRGKKGNEIENVTKSTFLPIKIIHLRETKEYLNTTRLGSDAVTDVTPEVWSHVRLKKGRQRCLTDSFFYFSDEQDSSFHESTSRHCTKRNVNLGWRRGMRGGFTSRQILISADCRGDASIYQLTDNGDSYRISGHEYITGLNSVARPGLMRCTSFHRVVISWVYVRTETDCLGVASRGRCVLTSPGLSTGECCKLGKTVIYHSPQ
ncbi:hypothetical protein J6590_088044 [Homalodisca vitripennis]|nr:hypothetical protein J6590_088044 [Homalodisca vitripennis]